MKVETKTRKKAMAGFRQLNGEDQARQSLYGVMSQGKAALDAVLMEMGKLLAESIMLMEREELAGPDYHPSDSELKKWAYEQGSIYIGDQKVKVARPRLRNATEGEVALKSYQKLRDPSQFSEELFKKILLGTSSGRYEETVINTAKHFGVSSSTISKKIVNITGQKLAEFQTRSLADFKPFAIFLDTIHRGGEAFLVALGIDIKGDKRALGFWQGSTENHAICQELFADLEKRQLALTHSVLYITDGGSGIIKALKDGFGNKLLHQRCVIHKSRNLQKHLAKSYRKTVHNKLKAALEQVHYDDAKSMLLELEQWLEDKNVSAAASLREAFEELLTLHRLKVPARLRKTLMSTNPIESMFSMVRQCEKNIKRHRNSKMLQRWLGSVLLHCESRFRRIAGADDIPLVLKVIEGLTEEKIVE